MNEKNSLMKKGEGNDTRRTMAGIVVIVLGLFLGLLIKRVTLGLLIGLALGLLLSGIIRKK